MMNEQLLGVLKAHLGQPLTSDLAADILFAADQLSVLVPADVIDKIQPEEHGEFTFARERIEDIIEEIKPLHASHWAEVNHHSLTLQPNYAAFEKYERAGRFVLFTLRKEERLLGQCSMYLSESAHTSTLISTEDALYLCQEARKGRTAMHFVRYVENALYQIGAREIEVSVKTTNNAARFFRMLGYKQIDIGLKKVMEDRE